jgi:hypothetical protein
MADHAHGRPRAARVMARTAVGLALLALVLSYLGRAVLRPAPFADRAVATLSQPAVQDDVADRLAVALAKSGNGDLVAVRPVVRSLARAVVGSGAFAALFRRAVLGAHNAVVEHDGGLILVGVADAGVLVQGLLERFAPAAAQQIGAERIANVLTLRPGAAVLDAVRIAKRVYSAAWLLAALALLVAIGAVFADRDEWRLTVRRIGMGMLVGGLAIVLLLALGRAIAEQAVPGVRGPVAAGVWDAFLGGLRVQALWFAAAGAACAGVVAAQSRPGGLRAGVGQGLRLLTRAEPGPGPLLLPALALCAAGAVIVLEPGAVLSAGAQAVGIYVLYRGVAGAANALAAKSASPLTRAHARARPAARLMPAVVPLVAVLGVAALILAGEGDEAPGVPPQTCNGFVALCSRPLNDVALAATHNSMASVTIRHWLFGQQDGTIKDQLEFGIRGLLIDSYYGFPTSDGVRTDLETLPKRELAEQQVGKPAVKAAFRLRSRLGRKPSGKRSIYLCHGFCELGSVTLASALADLRSFLVSNPGEVVVVINQDEGVPPGDIERAFQQAGLLDLVYRGKLGPFPTLRQMIDSGQRLVVMAENDAGEVPWYQLAYKHALQETPFTFKNVADLTEPSKLTQSCRSNRGPDSAPLFLLNHWVDTSPVPRASSAASVNGRGPLLERAQTCRRIRDRVPNLVAVDFYRHGDVLGVVNVLNGVGK